MVKVLHYVAIMDRGGQETFIMNVFRCIDRAEVMFDFLCTANRKGAYDVEINDLGGVVYPLPSSGIKVQLIDRCVSLWKFLKIHAKEYEAFHIHTQSAMDGYLSAQIAISAGVKKVIVHSHSTSTLYHPLLHKLFRPLLNSRKITKFACSDLAGKWLFGNNAKYKIIKNGVNTSQFSYSENIREKVRMQNGWTDAHVIGHVGSFTYPKNHEFLIDVFNEAIKLDGKAVLALVGTGPLLETITNKVCSLGLQNKVCLMGSRSDINELDNAFDIFVFPSHYEGLPVVLVEAQSTGVPCLVSDTITSEVLITDNIYTRSIESDPKIWAEEIERIIIENGRREYNSTAVTDAGFDIHDTADILQNFYCNSSEFQL